MPLGEREAAWTDLASLSLSRANNALDQGRLDDADRLAEQTEQWFERLPDGLEKRLKIAGVRQNRALIHRRLGRHVEAERRFKALDALMAQDPVTPREQEQRALVWLNRGENLDAMGRYEHAQYCHAQAQKIYDALPPGLDATLGGVNARINGAMTLGAQGRFDEAEHAFDAIDRLLEPLPRLAEVETARFSTALNRANNLQALARPEAAADVLERAAVSLRELGTEEELPFEYANLLTNQGVNATIACEYPAANAYLRRALTLAAALPNSDRSSMHRIVVWTNLMANALADRHINSAASMWPKCFRRLQALQGHPDAQLPEVATSLMQALVELGETGAIEAEECARRAMMLCNWSLDWLDMVNDPLDEKPPGAGQMATVFGLALGWMYGNFQSLLPELLSAQFGRFAAAIRQSSEESAACERDETHPVSALRRSIHRISGELQALETAAQTDDVNDAYDTATRVQALRAQREADVLTLRGALRNLRQSDGFADTITLERMHLAAGGPRGLRNRVLIVLFRFLSTEPAGKDGRTLLRPTAGALVVGPVSAFVTLPSLVLDVALHGRTTQAWPTAGVSPELVSDHLAGSPALNGAHTESHEMNADGWFLRRAVEVGWDAIRSRLSCVLNDVFIATHHELGHLPWQILNEHTPVRVFHGIALAINALERTEATRVIEPPGVDRPLGVLAHSPPNSGAYDASSSRATPAHAIPGVYADLVITRMQWPGASETLSGKEELLQHAPPLIQLSCHGNARIAHTGLEHDSTSAYELARVMSARAGSQRFEAVLTVACASAQAGTNAFGEAGGWSVALHGHVDAVLGALYPVDDVLCSLFVLLLHRSWAERRDLRLALDATRSRLRCGQWADSPAQEDHIHRQWTSALTEALARTSASVSRACAVIERANDHYANRDTLYLEDERLRLITEGFVILG
jgi:tetratricopeptide (TPR) repeat protein